MLASTVMTLRLEPELRKQLDELAKAQRRSRSFIAAEAIREYVAANERQIEEIREGLKEADRGEFATEQQVRRTLSKWTGRKRARRARADGANPARLPRRPQMAVYSLSLEETAQSPR